ncbi:hypothetical protein [Sphingobacterium corticibacter]|uniref:Uncharacterized protein n=1 Tax=Sphingobacterium corticibacter TaxID=2171749 RepID=A0A2T8HJZ4_9SPHI|nr:hypothetical protein [Sphingobacterium corticibacter]PVH25776.1 hypothetical protein DC487_07530 [Sphingobacterium corticibacter]
MEILERNALIKSAIIFICFLVPICFCEAQVKYFVLDEEHSSYNIKSYTLDTKDLYALDSHVEILNIFPIYNTDARNDREIILFSALPDVSTMKLWEKIDLSEIDVDTISFKDLLAIKQLSLYELYSGTYNEHNKFFNKYKLVVKRNGEYYVAYNTLLQFYALRDKPDMFNSAWGTINKDQTPVTVKSVAEYYKSIKCDFPLLSYSDGYSTFDRLRDRKEFLSKKFKIGSLNAYQFWSLTDWHMPSHAYEVDRGIDRFIYIPEKGIVGGSFDFYFYHHRKSINLNMRKFKENIYSERVMIANGLTD